MDTELLLLLEGSTGASSQVLSGSPVIIPSGEVSVLNLTANRWLRFNTSDVFPLRRGGALVTSHLTTVYMFGGRNERWVLMSFKSNISYWCQDYFKVVLIKSCLL